jgi:hypothetical protein
MRQSFTYLLVLAIGFQLLAVGLAAPAKLELDGKAKLERSDKSVQQYNRAGGTALTFGLEPGDRLCVIEGKGKLTFGVRNYSLGAAQTACFEVAKPKSFWTSLVQSCQDLGTCKKEAEKAFAKEAKSKGETSATAPDLYISTDFALSNLRLPVSGKTARLLDAGNKELLSLEASGETFEIPAEKLKMARRLEVKNASGVVVYTAKVLWVSLESEATPSTPREAALALMTSGNLSYAPAVYSYLLEAGEADLAKTVEGQIRAEFRGVSR